MSEAEEKAINDENDNEDIPHNRPRRTSKAVSFHSSANIAVSERRVSSVSDCWRCMVRGNTFVKIRANARTYQRYFSLDEDLSCVRWVPSSKKPSKACIPIDSIREVRIGKTTDTLRATKDLNIPFTADCAFTILYGEAFDSLDLFASTPEEANIWVTGLNALIGAQLSSSSMDEKSSARERWLKEVFEREAAACSENFMNAETALELMQKLCGEGTTSRIRQKLVEIDLRKNEEEKGRIDIKEFILIFKEISTRPEIYFLLIRFSNKDYLDLEDLQLFLEGEQGMTCMTKDQCVDIIRQYEPTSEAKENNQLLIDGFTRFLLSEDCDIFDQSQRTVCQDMNQPLAHYFISSSHNTYLLEDQLRGPSSIEGYIRALQYGCRCVKVDCWDGPEEPVVCHGNTLTTKILFADVLSTVAEFAFEASEYPLIIHLENHCSLRQQSMVAKLIRETLGDTLYCPPKLAKIAELTPQDLIRKVLIMGKKLASSYDDIDVGDVSDEDEGGETSAEKRKSVIGRRKIKLCKELSDVVSIVRSSSDDVLGSRDKQPLWVSNSISELQVSRVLRSSAEDLTNHSKTFLTRVFPNGSRVDSSNFNPQDYWNYGIQMVALHFQTPGTNMDLYDGRFRQNGGCGFVLKPAVMRDSLSVFPASAKDVVPGVAPQVLRLKIISGQQLPRPRGASPKASVVDPYVSVQIFGIPADLQEAKTRTVTNEGDNPIFEETFEFQINLPEVALVRFVVLDDEYIGDDFIGQNTIPFECLQTGYRHIRLLSNLGEPLENSTLFVHVAITNKRGGGKVPRNLFTRSKRHSDIKQIGIKQLDEAFKAMLPALFESGRARQDAETAMEEFRLECGLNETSNVKQCLRVLLQRLSASAEVQGFSLTEENGFPILHVQCPCLPPPLQRTIVCLERTLMESHWIVEHADAITKQLTTGLEELAKHSDEIESLCANNGLKGKKMSKAVECFAWNLRIVRGQLDLLERCKKESDNLLQQIRNSATTICTISSRGSIREKNKIQLNFKAPKPNTDSDCESPGSLSPRFSGTDIPDVPHLKRTPTSPVPLDLKPKSILKKSHSNLESNFQGYSEDQKPPTSPFARSRSPIPPVHRPSFYCSEKYIPCPPREYPDEE